MAVRTVDIALMLSGEKPFNDQIKSVNSNLSVLRSEMAAVSAEFKGNENSVSALSAKNKVLQDQYNQQKEAVRALEVELERVAKAEGEDSAAADRLRRQLNYTRAAVVKTKDALDENSKALSRAEKPYARLEASFVQLRRKVSDFKKDISEHTQLLQLAAKGSKELAALLAKGGVAAFAATGAAAFAAAKTLISFASESAAAAKAAKDAGYELTAVQQQWLEYSNILTNLDESANAAKAALGSILLPMLGDLSTKGTQLLFEFSDAMEAAAGDPEAMGRVVAEYVAKFAEALKEALPEIRELAKNLLKGIGEGLDENGDQLLDDAMEIVSMLLDGIISAAPRLGAGAGQLIARLSTELTAQGPAVLEAGLQLLLGILQGFAEGLPEFIEALPEMIDQIVRTLISLAPQFLDVGKQIVSGIWNGLKSAWGSLVSGVTGLFNDLISSVRGDQEIHSPSRKWGRMLGAPMAQGVGVDFKSAMKQVRRDISAELDPSSFPKLGGWDIPSVPGSAPAAGEGSTVSSRTVNGGINIVVNAAPGQSASEIADEVMQRMQNENETETEVFV